MNNYKFGNYICKKREELSLTQAELASILDVSDKTVSKWENGQAFPRMDTFERLALALHTTVEDILSASRDNVSRVCIVNSFGSILQIEINGQLYCLRSDESQWVELDGDSAIISVKGDPISTADFESPKDDTDVGLYKASRKAVDRLLRFILQADCKYKLSGLVPDTTIEIRSDIFDIGDKTMMYIDFHILYPQIVQTSGECELLEAKGKNSKEIIKQYKKSGLVSDLGMGFFFMFILYLWRGWYFKHQCKPHVLKKSIINAQAHKEATEKRENKKHGCLITILLFILVIVLNFFILPIFTVDTEKPALLAEDYSTVTYNGNIYTRIEGLPEYATPETILGATIWEDVRTEGLSNYDQLKQDDKVMLYEDYKGIKYLWLVENYADTMLTDEEKEYEDFKDPYVYMFDPKGEN